MDAAPVVVGIDVGKASRDLAVRPSGQQTRLANDEVGIAELGERLQALHPVLVGLEATGGLDVSVTAALAAAGHAVAVINPRQVRDFAQAVGQLAKIEALDAPCWPASLRCSTPRRAPCLMPRCRRSRHC
jgi:transposase